MICLRSRRTVPRPDTKTAARAALQAYRDWLRAKGRDPKEDSAYWVIRTANGLEEADRFLEQDEQRRAEADRRHRELMRRLKESDTR